MAICSTPLKSGLYLGFLLGGICFIGLFVLCTPPKSHFYISSHSKPVDEILAELYPEKHRYLYRDGCDISWAYTPVFPVQGDVKIPYGFVLIPIVFWGLTTLVYTAVVRCRYLFFAYSPPNTSPAPSETSETTPR